MHEYQTSHGGLQRIQGGRKFYEIPAHNITKGDSEAASNLRTAEKADPAQLSDYINTNIIGNKLFSFALTFVKVNFIYLYKRNMYV